MWTNRLSLNCGTFPAQRLFSNLDMHCAQIRCLRHVPATSPLSFFSLRIMDTSDEQLIDQIGAEHPYGTTAFEQLLRRYEPMVFRTCLRYLGNPQDAEEATQDAFLRVFHGAAKFSGKSKFKTWLYRIVANVCATRYGKIKKRSERQATYKQHYIDNFDADEAPSTHGMELDGPIAEALERLSEKDRQIISLRHVSDLTVPEIAEVLDVKLSAAKMRLSRAEEKLRDQYTKLKGENPGFLKNL